MKFQNILYSNTLAILITVIALVGPFFVVRDYYFSPSLFTAKAGQNDITIHARGTNGAEKIALYINDQPIEFWDLSTNFQDYAYVPSEPVTINSIAVHFINDRWEPQNDINYDVQIDYITVNGDRYDSEHASTSSTGTWDQNNWCAPGNKSNEWLHCAGAFTYNVPQGTVVGEAVVGTALSLFSAVSENATDTTVDINFTLSEVAQAQIEYGETIGYGNLTNRENSFDYVSHGQTISGLQEGTTYHYRILATSQSGENLVSTDYTFTTSGSVVVTMPTITPVNGAMLIGSSQELTIAAPVGYTVGAWVGSTVGGSDYYDTGSQVPVNAQGEAVFTVSGWPAAGSPVYIRVGYREVAGAAVQWVDFTWTANTTVNTNSRITNLRIDEITQNQAVLKFDIDPVVDVGVEIDKGNGWVTLSNAGAYPSHSYGIHNQTALTRNTSYTIRVTPIGTTPSSVQFATLAEGVPPPPPTGASMTFSQIDAGAESWMDLQTDEDYVAEFLRQRRVRNDTTHSFYQVENNSVAAAADPTPMNSTSNNLPAPSGGNDADALTAAVNNAPAGSTLNGQGRTYRVSGWNINKSINLINMDIQPSGNGIATMVTVGASDVHFFDTDIDGLNRNIRTVFNLQSYDDFWFVRSSAKNIRYDGKLGGVPHASIFYGKSVDDIYITASVFENLLATGDYQGPGGNRIVWFNGFGGGHATNGGVFTNNTVENIQGTGGLTDSDVVVIQTMSSSQPQGRSFFFGANHMVNAGGRAFKSQEGGGNVNNLSNYYHWVSLSGPLGNRVQKAFHASHDEENYRVRNNRIINDAGYSAQGIIEFGGIGIVSNLRAEYNYITWNVPNNSPRDFIISGKSNATGSSRNPRNSAFSNNVVDGSGYVDNFATWYNGYTPGSLTYSNNDITLNTGGSFESNQGN